MTRALGDTNAGDDAKPSYLSGGGRHTVSLCDWSSGGCSFDLTVTVKKNLGLGGGFVAASSVTVTASWVGAGSITGGTCTTTTKIGRASCRERVKNAAAGQGTL